jgi:ubiquitin-protein ligase
MSTSKRLTKELKEMNMDPPPFCSAGIRSNNLYNWHSTIVGPVSF